MTFKYAMLLKLHESITQIVCFYATMYSITGLHRHKLGNRDKLKLVLE